MAAVTRKRERVPIHLRLGDKETERIRHSIDNWQPKRRKYVDVDKPSKDECNRNNIISENFVRRRTPRGRRSNRREFSRNECIATMEERGLWYFGDYGFNAEFIQSLGLQTYLSSTVDVTQLHACVDQEKLFEVFSLAGHVKQIHYNYEHCSAKIEYDNPVEAVQAIYIFRNQTLFDKEINIEMDYSPKALPVGLSGINKGFLQAAGSLKRIWTKREFREAHETDKSDSRDQFSSDKRNKSITRTCVVDSPTISSTTVPDTNTTDETLTGNCDHESSDMDLDSNEDPNETSQTVDDNIKVIEELAAVLKNKGLLPTDFDCKDAKSILAAIKSNAENQHENKTVDKNRENSIQNLNKSTDNNSSCAKANALEAPQQEDSLQQTSNNQVGDNSSPNMSTKNSPNAVNSVSKTVVCSKQAELAVSPSGQDVPLSAPSSDCAEQITEPPIVLVVPKLEPLSPQRQSPEHENQTVENRDPRLRNRDSPKNCPTNNPGFVGGSNQKSKPRPYSRLIFRNLPPGVSEAELFSKMSGIGDLLYCEGPINGLAIVAFSSLQDAERCIRLFHRSKVDGQVIDVMLVS